MAVNKLILGGRACLERRAGGGVANPSTASLPTVSSLVSLSGSWRELQFSKLGRCPSLPGKPLFASHLLQSLGRARSSCTHLDLTWLQLAIPENSTALSWGAADGGGGTT